MKRFVFLVGVLMVSLIVIIAINTTRFASKQLTVTPAQPVAVDTEAAALRLAGALRIPTIAEVDTTLIDHAAFDALHAYLAQAFPSVHASLQQNVINRHSLLYLWEGTAPDLDPLVLMSHLDVVPVEPGTESNWQHAPFVGHIDTDHIWGRGALDDKNGVLAILEAVEMLIQGGFQPTRSVMLAFGHDEEIGGRRGASYIADRLEMAGVTPWLVVDEGGVVLEDHPMPVDAPLALVGIAEKGSLSLLLSVEGPGGHSSMPDRETTVGILSGAIDKLSHNPFPGQIGGVSKQILDYLGPEMSLLPKAVFANQWLFSPLIVRQLSASPSSDALLRTTIAPTMLKASPKANVLPARAEAVVNFRIVPGETIKSVEARVREVVNDPRVEIKPYQGGHDNPSGVSSTTSEAFLTLQRSIHEVFPEAVFAPYLMVGGSDAKHFSRLSDNVYRFLPVYFREGDLARMHGTNERISKADYANAIRFYHRLIRNVGE
ncbi:MAG: M20 family peptidase [Bacteroidota bacterium]